MGGPHLRGRRVRGVGGDAAGWVGLDRPVVAEVDVDEGRGVDVGQHGIDAADVDQEGSPELSQNPDIDVAGRTDRTDQRRILALEDGGVAGDAAFDGLFEDDVGLVHATLWPRRGVVVDLHGQGRPCRDGGTTGNGCARERAGGNGGGCRGGARRGRGARVLRARMGGRGGRACAQHEAGQSAHAGHGQNAPSVAAPSVARGMSGTLP